MLEATGTRPDTLALELTETFLLEQSANTAAVLEQLEALGVGLMLDDFGTGYSSLSHLQRFPLDAIKIDRSFVSEIGRTEGGAAIIAAVVGMADGLGLRVIAEGVETEEHVSAPARPRLRVGAGLPVRAAVPARRHLGAARRGAVRAPRPRPLTVLRHHRGRESAADLATHRL
jgi:EAL domain-containing protein (putative c-di-GMP-specific phosphodiesterase class I)